MDIRLKREGEDGEIGGYKETNIMWEWRNDSDTEIIKTKEGAVQGKKAERKTTSIYQKDRHQTPAPLFHSQHRITAVNSSTRHNFERCIWFVVQHTVERGGRCLIYEPGSLWSGLTTFPPPLCCSSAAKIQQPVSLFGRSVPQAYYCWTVHAWAKKQWRILYFPALEIGDSYLL